MTDNQTTPLKKDAKPGTVDDRPARTPEQRAWPWSYIVWGHVAPLISLGKTRQINDDDYWNLRRSQWSAAQTADFEKRWEAEVQRTAGDESKKPSLCRMGCNKFCGRFSLALFLKLLVNIFSIGFPIIFAELVRWFEPGVPGDAKTRFGYDTKSKEYGLIIAGILVAINFLEAFANEHANFLCHNMGIASRAGMLGAVHRKILSLPQNPEKAGKAMSIATADTASIRSHWPQFIEILSPITIAGGLYLLWGYLGASIFIGFGAMVVTIIPFMMCLQGTIQRLLKERREASDRRYQAMNEALGAIKIIKMYGWELAFSEKLNAAREAELSVIRRQIWVNISTNLIFLFAPFMLRTGAYIGFITLRGGELDAVTLFTSEMLIGTITIPFGMVTWLWSALVDTNVIMKRIRLLLTSGDVTTEPFPYSKNTASGLYCVSAKAGEDGNTPTYYWEAPKTEEQLEEERKEREAKKKAAAAEAAKKAEEAGDGIVEAPERATSNSSQVSMLRDSSGGSAAAGEQKTADIEAPETDAAPQRAVAISGEWEVVQGQTCGVIGTVGAGKSALLKTILRETFIGHGSMNNSFPNVSYCDQVAWIQNGTVRENITFFGREAYDPAWYNTVVKACALDKDMKTLPSGDQTLIGEKGVNLSGGQKQRIALARSVYCSRGKISETLFVFDDVLSAVDPEVGDHIFKKCVRGLLKGGTVVLVTNSEKILGRMDTLIVVQAGRVVFQGTKAEYEKSPTSAIFGSLDGLGQKALSMQRSASKQVSLGSDSSGKLAKKEGEAGNEKDAENQEEEKRKYGSVDTDIYLIYWREGKGFHFLMAIFLATAVRAYIGDIQTNWINIGWTRDVMTYQQEKALGDPDAAMDNSQWYYLGLSTGNIFLFGIAYTIPQFMIAIHGIAAGRNLHKNAAGALFGAPQTYFDTTPIGRTLNRLGADLGAVDNQLPTLYKYVIDMTFGMAGALFWVSYASRGWFTIAIPIIFLLYRHYQLASIKTVRELRRIVAVQAAPILSKLSELMNGTTTVRAFKEEDSFQKRILELTDQEQNTYYTARMVDSWFRIRLALTSLLLLAAGSFLLIWKRELVSASLAGAAIVGVRQVTQTIKWAMNMANMIQEQSVAVERLEELKHIEQEADAVVPDKTPAESWPSGGQIVIRNLKLQYRPDLPMVLHGIDLTVHAGERIGVCGRSGCGKSSLFMALLRMVEPRLGTAYEIDGVDCLGIGVRTLRQRVSLMPQDPTLFADTIRFNVDPLKQHTDAEIMEALKIAYLDDVVNQLPDKLDAIVKEGGSNFSVGQRQLFCLARAILRRTKILLLDEATSSVDPGTDDKIQRAIRTAFKGCTILTIAHRVNTILDCDRILVLGEGRVKELAPPKDLLDNPDSEFRKLVKIHYNADPGQLSSMVAKMGGDDVQMEEDGDMAPPDAKF